MHERAFMRWSIVMLRIPCLNLPLIHFHFFWGRILQIRSLAGFLFLRDFSILFLNFAV